MTVLYYVSLAPYSTTYTLTHYKQDVVPIMSLGSAKQLDTLDELLAAADFLSLHVPELPETTNMIGATEIAKMKDGSYLLNNARGKVIDIPALVAALQSGHLAGAAVDVFPSEPAKNGPHFTDELNGWASALRACPNLILTPHIGGSTEEAQRMIGAEVASALLRYVNYGSTVGAVNFPEVNLRPILHEGTVRLCHVHLNQPGVLKIVNSILGEHNVEKQFSVRPLLVRSASRMLTVPVSPTQDSKGDIAYLLADIVDVDEREIKEIYDAISKTRSNVATRFVPFVRSPPGEPLLTRPLVLV